MKREGQENCRGENSSNPMSDLYTKVWREYFDIPVVSSDSMLQDNLIS